MDKKTMICDFCSGTPVVRGFACPDFSIAAFNLDDDTIPLHWGSLEGWAACEVCAQLVEAGKQEELLERSLRTSGAPDIPPIRQMLGVLHGTFWRGLDLSVYLEADGTVRSK